MRSSGTRLVGLGVTLALAALSVAIGVLGGLAEQRAAEERRAVDDTELLTEVAVSLRAEVQAILARVHDASRGAERGTAPTADGADVPVTRVDAGDVDDSSALDEARDSIALPLLLALASDTGDVRVSPPYRSEGTDHVLFVAAVYEQDGEVAFPTTTQQRRELTTAYAVADVDPTQLSSLEVDPADDAVVAVADGSTPLVSPESPVEDLPATDLQVGSRRWTVRVGSAAEVTSPILATWLPVLGVLVGAVLVALHLLSMREQARVATERDRAAGQIELISSVAPVVQQSLELADVLPAIAVQLVDHFDLAGISVSVTGDAGQQVELFATGVQPDRSVPVRLQPPTRLTAGETAALALQRGGRTVAVLRLVGASDLSTQDLEPLGAIGELVTAAIVNARLYRRQQETMSQLRELDELKTVFLGTASHELRTPVTAITGFTRLLTDNWDDLSADQRQSFARRIHANGRALDDLVQDLLDFSRVEQGTLDLPLEDVDLSELVQQVADRLAPLLEDHELDLRVAVTEPIAANPIAVERIVTNLLSNAAKFSPPTSTVTIEVAPDGDGAALTVSDQGPGIPAEERERIFTRFFRGSGEAVVRSRGVGIGLSVVQEFAGRMGATIDVDDAPGGGARFTVRFRPAGWRPADHEETIDAQAP